MLGGGITGLTTALLLKRDGARVVVLEATRVGHGVTGCTTAKFTALQQTVYGTLRSRHGGDGAAVYAEASAAAVELPVALAAEDGIDCDLERRPAFTYAPTVSERSTVEREHEAASEAGLPVTLVDDADLPYGVDCAVRLDDQVQLHPVRYVQGLAAAVHGDGSQVLEQTRTTAVDDGNPCRVHTEHGTVTAQQVVVATHYPLLDRGLFFARLEPTRSYAIAARVRGAVPRAMSISAGGTTRSVRAHGELLIVGGEGHSTGARSASRERHGRLEQFAREHWDVEAVSHRWSAQDPVSWDHMPVIGRYHPGSSRLFVASGFHKWAMTSATFAGRILSDLIAGRNNPWAARFSPSRVGLRGLPKLAQINAKVALDFVGDRLRLPRPGSAAGVPPGEAHVLAYYEAIAPVLLPHLAGRPLTLGRFPAGRRRARLRDHRMPRPARLGQHRRSHASLRRRPRAVRGRRPGLAFVGGESGLDRATRLPSAADRLDEARFVVLDLDPGPATGIAECCRVALWLREALAEAGQVGFCKTSGGLGLHVYVPLGPGHSFDESKAFAHSLAACLGGKRPYAVTDMRATASRAGRVLVDWIPNSPRALTVTPYSLRAADAPYVSSPSAGKKSKRRRRTASTGSASSPATFSSVPTTRATCLQWAISPRARV